MNKIVTIIRLVLILTFTLSSYSGIQCQTFAEINQVLNVFEKDKKKTNHAIITVKSVQSSRDSEAEIILYGLFLFYKSFLSSQDINSCNFHPSCSEYCLHSIKAKGFIKGGLMTFDRMVRCNPLSLHNYPFDPTKNKFLDPVDE
jgi:uncharacterized protein